MTFLLILLLMVIAFAVFGIVVYPKMSVQHKAKRDGIGNDVWYQGQVLKERCQQLKTYYPIQFPTFAIASLAMCYETFLKTRASNGEEEILTEFIAPADYEALFNVVHKSHIPTNDEQVEEQGRKYDCVAFVLTSKNRLIFARWRPFATATGSYSVDPRHLTVQTPAHVSYAEFYISPNANNEQEVLGKCNMPFKSVSNAIAENVLSKSNELGEKSLTIDEEGRRIL